MDFKIIIPARYASTRLPGKVLLDINGKPMIQHVYERTLATDASEVIIATDSDVIAEAAKAFSAKVCMTRSDHVSGTERLGEVVDQLGWSDDCVVVNVQGDEPLIPPKIITQVAKNLIDNAEAACASLMTVFTEKQSIANPNIVKVVVDKNNHALYFSRSVIPCVRDPQDSNIVTHYWHVGIYAYRASLLRNYASLPVCELETIEKLEQLRLLWNGYKIHMANALEVPEHGVDTESDLEHVRSLLA